MTILKELYSMIKQKRNWSNILFFLCITTLFLLDTLLFYVTHYYAFYAVSYVLLLQFLFKDKKIGLLLFFLMLELCFTLQAPHLVFFLFFIFKKISFLCNAYLYTSPSIPFAVCVTGFGLMISTIRLYTGYWPFCMSIESALHAVGTNIACIGVIVMVYCWYGKQGSR